jgi:hypothetical protein
MELWLLRAKGTGSLDVKPGAGVVVLARHYDAASDTTGALRRYWLLEGPEDAARAVADAVRAADTWDVELEPAPDGAYLDVPRGENVVVRDGRVCDRIP